MSAMQHSVTRKGSAFIMVVAVLVILMSLSIALTDTTVSASQESGRRKDEVALSATAESMTNLAMRHLQGASFATAKANPTTRYDISAQVKTLAQKDILSYLGGLAGGTGRETTNGMDVQATWGLHGSYDGMVRGGEKTDIYRLLVTASDNGPARLYNADGSMKDVANINKYRRQRIEVLFTTQSTYYFSRALYAYDSYDVSGTANTDSWDSQAPAAIPYAPTRNTHNGDVESGGQLNVRGSGNVDGTPRSDVPLPISDLVFNPPSDANRTAIVTTSTKSYSAAPLASGNYLVSALRITSDTSQVTFADASTVTIYVDGPIELSANWPISPRCTVTLYQNDFSGADAMNVNLNNRTSIGCPTNPGAFRWVSMSPCTIQNFNGGSSVGGVFFWPYATIKNMNGNAEFYGSMICKSLTDRMNGGYSFHYDDSLARVSLPLPPALVVVGWRSFPVGFSKDQDDDQ